MNSNDSEIRQSRKWVFIPIILLLIPIILWSCFVAYLIVSQLFGIFPIESTLFSQLILALLGHLIVLMFAFIVAFYFLRNYFKDSK